MKLTHEMCNHLFENASIEEKRWVVLFLTELENARQKHPKWPADHIHAAAIVQEETGELIRAAVQVQYEKGPFYHMYKEAIQVGAMALRFIVDSHKPDRIKRSEKAQEEIKDREPKYQINEETLKKFAYLLSKKNGEEVNGDLIRYVVSKLPTVVLPQKYKSIKL